MNKLSAASAQLFQREINNAMKRGQNYFAKAVGSASMRFGATLEEAEAKAQKDADRIAKRFGGSSPWVNSGSII